jgi:hypothetical protein
MKRTNGKGDVRTSTSEPGHTKSGAAAVGSSFNSSPDVQPTAEQRTIGVGKSALSHLLLRDDGWLRAIPDGAGKAAYLKWKFTRGKFSGSYVMVVVHAYEWPMGFTLLTDKIEDCYAGLRKPTKDRDYLPIFDSESAEE